MVTSEILLLTLPSVQLLPSGFNRAFKSRQHLRQYLQDNTASLLLFTIHNTFIAQERSCGMNIPYQAVQLGVPHYIAMTSKMTKPPPSANFYSSLPSARALTIWFAHTIQRPRHPLWNIWQSTNPKNVWGHRFQPNLKWLSWIFIYERKAFYLDGGLSSLQKAPIDRNCS